MARRGVSIGRLATAAVLLAVVFANAASAQMATFPQGRFSMFPGLEWEPDCDLFWPTRYGQTDERYRQQVREWMDCADRQARNDLQAASDAISAGREQAFRDKLRELGRL